MKCSIYIYIHVYSLRAKIVLAYNECNLYESLKMNRVELSRVELSN